ncbi:porin [Vitiosangium sp. GDMCC 1.1324]|uniref:porin n=1 Tax=Vitiosangium sp. (strain GDMCC 1.1324) TaxID=2138576 RepID=UPI000D3D4983|nr:porin [Vitiosangium sp. GDMCC 1.1324]PTL84181.1 hypothetical protein DAT35_12140 [Vitiosangium sp. GDMCC 1.1324]
MILASSARAQDAAPQEAPEASKTEEAPEAPPAPAPSTAPAPEETSDSLRLPSAFGSVTVGGRLSVREALGAKGEKAWSGELSIPAARIELTYQWKKRLRAVVELDVQDGLKDAYISLNLAGGFSVRAGHFKVPLSLVELESTTRLPLVRRGLLRDVLSDALGLTGRRIGAQLEWKCTGCERALKLRAGVWQMDDSGDKAPLADGLGLVPGFRGTWEVLDSLELGVSAMADTRSTWTAGVDAKHSLPIGQGELRTWAEVLVGRNALLVGAEGPLLTARALTAWRIGGGRKGALFLEPFLMLSLFDPDLQLPEDRLWEAAGGLNFGQRGRWRLQAQVESRRAEASVPASVQSLDNSLTDRRAVLLQMEVSF